MYREAPIGVTRLSDGKRIHRGDADWPAVLQWISSGGDLQPQNPRPSDFHDWNGSAWVENLDRAREFVRSALTRNVDTVINAGATVNGKLYHADDRFLGELQLMMKGLDRGLISAPVSIRRKDNVTEQFSELELETLALSVGLFRQIAYQMSWAGKDQLSGKTTLAEILALLP